MNLVQAEELAPGPRVGEGPLPPEFDRVNWGALLLAMLWALFNAPWPWFFILAGARIALAAAGFYFYGLGLGEGAQLLFTLTYMGLYWALVVVFAFRANALAWESQRSRVARESDQSVPRPARLLSDYASAQGQWIIVGVIVLLLSWLDVMDLRGGALSGGGTGTSQYAVIAVDAVVIAGVFVADRLKRRRMAS